MKKKLLVLLFVFTLGFTLTACKEDSVPTQVVEQSINQIILNNVIDEVSFTTNELLYDITLPTTQDGYTFTWTSNSPSTITNDGKITRPAIGEGDSIVVLTLTVTSNGESVSREFTFTVKEATEVVIDPDDTVYTYEGYYEGVEGLSGDTLKAFLHNLIDDHTVISYGGLRDALQESDEDPSNTDNIILLYSGDSIDSTWDSGATWNREHVWPKSLGGFADDIAGSDMHHIRPTYTTVNSARGNKLFDDGGTLVSKTTDCYTDSNSFEPRDEVKGDVARMMFYMVVRYEGNDGAAGSDLELAIGEIANSSGLLGDLETLMEWNLEDPVDDYERNRNDVIFSYQDNRNPFIDHPELVQYIWGDSVPTTDPDDNQTTDPDANQTTDPDDNQTTDPDDNQTTDPDNTEYSYVGYYDGVEGLNGDILKAFLHDLIDNHTVISYGNLRDALQNSDEDPNDKGNIILLYSGDSIKSTWDSGATWNREHVWPKSLGGFKSDDAGSDMHHIRPTYTTVNSTRGNKFFDDGGSLVSKTDDCYSDSNSFEPRDEVKGDVARMMFYMAVRYEGNDGAAGSDLELVFGETSSTNGLLGDLETLLQWSLDDPVDDFERNRNDVIYSYQHNRNPFIDHPELISLIWGS